MFKQMRSVSAFVMAAALMAAPACAAQRPYYGNQRDVRDFERRAYDDGYRQGFDNGQRDARDRRDFRVDRDRVYRDERFGRNDEYRRVFRNGYQEGYSQGYNRVARLDRRDYRTGAPVNGRYNNGSVAVQIGYRDGLQVGRDDASNRQNYDPRRAKWYRDGDHDYNNRYGSRDQYTREYRDAFIQGYEEGYRGNRR